VEKTVQKSQLTTSVGLGSDKDGKRWPLFCTAQLFCQKCAENRPTAF